MYDGGMYCKGVKETIDASQCISLSLIHLKSLDRLKVINIVLRCFFLLIDCRLQAAMCFLFQFPSLAERTELLKVKM